MQEHLRLLRGWLYRQVPPISLVWFQKKLKGYERRWGLEKEGFTKEGFLRIFQQKVLSSCEPGAFYELAAGDGLVGSLGVWLERLGRGWEVDAWECRAAPLYSLRKNRPQADIHHGRLITWSEKERGVVLKGITTRGAREAAGVCREIRTGKIRPFFVGIWNPSRRDVWYRRLLREGYQFEMAWHNMEFYRSKQK
jgi:hypothetical protein